MIPGTTIAIIATASSLGLTSSIAIWWRSLRWKLLSSSEETAAHILLSMHDSLDHHDTVLGDLSLHDDEDESPVESGQTPPLSLSSPKKIGKRQLTLELRSVTASESGLSDCDAETDPLTILASYSDRLLNRVHPDLLGKRVVELKPHNHLHLAKIIADECKLNLTVTCVSEANVLCVTKWIKNRLRLIPNLRRAHALAILPLARNLVFTPTSQEVFANTLFNSEAFMERRRQFELTRVSAKSGLWGWLAGHRRIVQPPVLG